MSIRLAFFGCLKAERVEKEGRVEWEGVDKRKCASIYETMI